MKTNSLNRQFTVWTLVLVVIPSVLTMAIYTVSQIAIVKQHSMEMIQGRLAAQERLIDYWMAERMHDVSVLSQSEVVRSLDEQKITQLLYFEQQNNTNFDSLSYVNRDGMFRVSTLSQEIQHPSVQGRPYYDAAKGGKEYISDVVIGRNSGRPIINFSSPIFDDKGAFCGLILGSITTATLERLLHDNWIGQTGEVFLVNRQGFFLTEPRFFDSLVARGFGAGAAKMKMKITDDAFEKIRLGESGTANWVDYLGNKVLGAYLDVPERQWTLIGKMNETEVLSPMYLQLVEMAGGTFVLLLLILPLATWFTNKIKQPIDWLIQQANLAAAEEYGKVGRAAYSGAQPYELTVLCDTFAAMGRKMEKSVGLLKEKEMSLRSKVEEIQEINSMLEGEVMEHQAAEFALQQLNRDLENRVIERTRELQDLNAQLEEEVSERTVAERELAAMNLSLQASEAQFRKLFEHMLNAFVIRKVIVDSAGRPADLEYVEVNPAFEKMFGLSAAEVIGRCMTEVFPGIGQEKFHWVDVLGSVALGGEPVIVEEFFLAAKKWIRMEAYSPRKGLVACVMQDITENKRSEEQLQHYSSELEAFNKKLLDLNDELQQISLSDGLTGIANRRYFDEYIEREWRRAKREKQGLALLMLDVDFFKAYNDTYGHLGGDECLRRIAALLRVLPKRAGDVAARFGGEEFALVLPNTDREGAAAVAETVRKEVEELAIEHKASSIRQNVTVSIGVAVVAPQDQDTVDSLIEAADRALYQAKTEGRNRVVVV